MGSLVELDWTASMSEARRGRNTRWIPALSELVFASVLAWLFLAGAGAVALLGDGDIGWHIRTGEHILTTRSFPQQDLFSFSRAGQPWFAWEWLSDVAFASVHSVGGLPGVVLLAGVLIAATSAVLLRYMIWQGSNLLIAVVAMLVASSAATIHWLARPHVFSYLLLVVSVWVLEMDRRRRTGWIFGLVGLSILWTNLHGGFAALVATVGIYLAGSVAETLWAPAESRTWDRAKRYGLLLGLVAAGTLANPYSYRLHQHIFRYLRSDFILNHNQEFLAPNFRGEGMGHFELLLFAGLACVPALLKRKDVTLALLVLFWAHAALTSARHVLLYVVVSAPIVARELTVLWERAARRGADWIATLRRVTDDYGTGRYGSGRGPEIGWLSPVSIVLVGVVLFTGQHQERLRAEFPRARFPVEACAAVEGQLAGRRIFTSDQWADYLIYRYYPKLKVFFDGRSDFYGPELGQEYLRAMNSHHQWEQIFERHGFDLALLPTDWPLATTIKGSSNWKVRYDDGRALLLERIARGTARARSES